MAALTPSAVLWLHMLSPAVADVATILSPCEIPNASALPPF